MNWTLLERSEQLEQIRSSNKFSVIFKHSNRCNISKIAKQRFEEYWAAIPAETQLYFLDIISDRALSTEVAEVFSTRHESPQMLIIKDGKCIYSTSHHTISAEDAAVHIILAQEN